MSRSNNGRRGIKRAHNGREVWSARPTHYQGASFDCKEVKRDTHKFERRIAKKELQDDTIH